MWCNIQNTIGKVGNLMNHGDCDEKGKSHVEWESDENRLEKRRMQREPFLGRWIIIGEFKHATRMEAR